MEIDGKGYGTSSVTKGLARHRLAQRGKEPAGGGGEEPQAAEGHSMHDHGGQEGGHEAIQQVHEEHGPATKVEVKHDGEHHHVTTTHEDGHVHESKGHPSVAHVHEHIGHSIGTGGAEQHSEPDGDEGAGALEAMGVSGAGSEDEG